MVSNRYASEGFRDRVLLRLHSAGLAQADVLSRDESVAVPLRGKGNVIVGLPWTALVRLDRGPLDLSGALDDAAALAGHFGNDRSAVVAWRKGRSIGESYVVTTLDEFVGSIAERTRT